MFIYLHDSRSLNSTGFKGKWAHVVHVLDMGIWKSDTQSTQWLGPIDWICTKHGQISFLAHYFKLKVKAFWPNPIENKHQQNTHSAIVGCCFMAELSLTWQQILKVPIRDRYAWLKGGMGKREGRGGVEQGRGGWKGEEMEWDGWIRPRRGLFGGSSSSIYQIQPPSCVCIYLSI